MVNVEEEVDNCLAPRPVSNTLKLTETVQLSRLNALQAGPPLPPPHTLGIPYRSGHPRDGRASRTASSPARGSTHVIRIESYNPAVHEVEGDVFHSVMRRWLLLVNSRSPVGSAEAGM